MRRHCVHAETKEVTLPAGTVEAAGDPVKVEMARGDVLLLHSGLMHASAENDTDRLRAGSQNLG